MKDTSLVRLEDVPKEWKHFILQAYPVEGLQDEAWFKREAFRKQALQDLAAWDSKSAIPFSVWFTLPPSAQAAVELAQRERESLFTKGLIGWCLIGVLVILSFEGYFPSILVFFFAVLLFVWSLGAFITPREGWGQYDYPGLAATFEYQAEYNRIMFTPQAPQPSKGQLTLASTLQCGAVSLYDDKGILTEVD